VLKNAEWLVAEDGRNEEKDAKFFDKLKFISLTRRQKTSFRHASLDGGLLFSPRSFSKKARRSGNFLIISHSQSLEICWIKLPTPH
jgi:hypothetical protein